MGTSTYFDTIKSEKTIVSVWHARGNQGAVGAVGYMAELAMKAGCYASAFGVFGAEKAGAPIMAFNRDKISPIDAFYAPSRFDLVVILDATIGGFSAGTHKDTIFVVNTAKKPEAIARELGLGPARIIAVDATGIAQKTMPKGFQYPNTPMLGAVIKVFPELTLSMLLEVIREAPNLVEKGQQTVDVNVEAAKQGYETAQEFDGRGTDIPRIEAPAPKTYMWYEFEPAGAITTTGNAAEKKTGAWRTERPIFMAKNCTHCLKCYHNCPDFSILVDNPEHPTKMLGFDLDHCKGCMICRENCEFNAIGVLPEARAQERDKQQAAKKSEK